MPWFDLFRVFKSLPRPSSVTLKRSAIVAASLVGLLTILSAANYFRRRRKQKKFLKQNGEESLQTSAKRKKQKQRNKQPETSTANSSPKSGKYQRARRRRRNSLLNSFTSSSSAVSSIKNSRQPRSPFPAENDESFYQVEALYQEGVDSFENALHKWEEASTILQKSSSHTPRNLHSQNKRKSLKFYSDDESRPSVDAKGETKNDSLRASLLRSNSFSTSLEPAKGTNNNYFSQSEGHLDDLLHELEAHNLLSSPGSPLLCKSSFDSCAYFQNTPEMNLLRKSISDLEENARLIMASFTHHKIDIGGEKGPVFFEEQLQSIIEHAQHLQDAFDTMLYSHSDTGSDTDMTLTGFDDMSDYDSESNESFVSAHEFLDIKSEEVANRRLFIYEKALEAVERGEVPCRTMRSDLLECFSDDEFLAKLHCVRSGLTVMLDDVSVREWLVESGRSMIECILCAAERNIDDFRLAFSRMIEFVDDPKNWPKIEEELKARRVAQLSFYDIVLDFLIMDAFDDLESPPSAVISIMQNRWLADSLKESALSAAVWSVLKAKRSRLMYQDGFVAHLYDISDHVSPVLAWGFMGPEGRLKDVCERFKEEVIGFLRDLFNFDCVRYTTNAQMADDILKLTREKFETLLLYLHSPAAHDVSR